MSEAGFALLLREFSGSSRHFLRMAEGSSAAMKPNDEPTGLKKREVALPEPDDKPFWGTSSTRPASEIPT